MLPARRPYADELCSSAVIRCCRQFRIPVKRLGRVVLGREGWHPSFLGATPLAALAEMFRLDPGDLLWKHSAFPFATAAMATESFANGLSNAWGNAAQGVGLGALMQNATMGVPNRRFCVDCVATELKAHSESFWHVSHHLPGVWVCPWHLRYLSECEISVRSFKGADLRLPNECNPRPLGHGAPPVPLVKAAMAALEWLRRNRGPGQNFDAHYYRSMASSSGWVALSRQVSSQPLSQRVLTLFPPAYLSEPGLLRKNRADWLALMLRPGVNVPFSPVKHLIAHVTLGSAREDIEPSLEHIPLGPIGTAALTLDEMHARHAATELRAALRRHRLLTTEEFLRAADCWQMYRHRKQEMPKLREVVCQFRSSSASVKPLAPGQLLFKADRSVPRAGN